MANPQVEDGHIDIANQIAEALARIRISGEENQCLWVVFRKTYGWRKKEDKISLSQFSKVTGLNRPAVARALKRLLSKKILLVIKKDNSQVNTYRFNKDFDKWEPLEKRKSVIKKDNSQVLSKKIMGVINIDNRVLSKKIPTIDNITKDTLTNTNTPLPPKGECEDVEIKKINSLKKPQREPGNPKSSGREKAKGKACPSGDEEKLAQFFEEKIWPVYPCRRGKKLGKANTKAWYVKNITFDETLRTEVAVKNYTDSGEIPRDAIRFFRGLVRNPDWDWRDWVESPKKELTEDEKLKQELTEQVKGVNWDNA